MELIKIWLQNIVRNEPKVPTQDSLGVKILYDLLADLT